MTLGRITVPVAMVNGQQWADLSALHHSYDIVGETVKQLKDMSFKGGHRVRLYKFKSNVHFKIPEGVTLDISAVPPGNTPPRRNQPRS